MSARDVKRLQVWLTPANSLGKMKLMSTEEGSCWLSFCCLGGQHNYANRKSLSVSTCHFLLGIVVATLQWRKALTAFNNKVRLTLKAFKKPILLPDIAGLIYPLTRPRHFPEQVSLKSAQAKLLSFPPPPSLTPCPQPLAKKKKDSGSWSCKNHLLNVTGVNFTAAVMVCYN